MPTDIVASAATAASAAAIRHCRLMRRLAGGVADAAHGLDQAGLTLGLGLAPQVADVHGEVLRVGAEVVVPDAVVDRRVVEHDTLVAHEQLEQVELGLREIELTGAAPGPPGRRVDAQIGQLHDLVPGLRRLRAAQQRPQPCQQLVQLERLREVVVGARIEPGHPVTGLRPRGEHQDRDLVAVGAQHLAHRQAVDDGHRHVEHDDVGRRPSHGLERLGTVADGDDVVALEAERTHERLTYGAVVLGQQQRVARSSGAQCVNWR